MDISQLQTQPNPVRPCKCACRSLQACFEGAGLIAAVGISQLQFTDANSPRNIFIVGLGLYLVRQSTQTFFVAVNLVPARS